MAVRPARVIVGVDGSTGSIEALRCAAHEAARRGMPLHVMTCVQLPVTVEAGLVGSGSFAGSSMDALVAEQEQVNQRAVDLARSLGLDLSVSGETVLGAPGYALVSASCPDDIVVTGATSHPGRLTDLLGSVATVVAHRAKGAVIVVHGTCRTDHAVRRIVVGVDGSETGNAALAWAAEVAIRTGAQLLLVHGWTYPYAGLRSAASEPRDEMRLDAMRVLDASTQHTKQIAPTITTQAVISEETPAKAILDAAASADLIVVGSRGHGGFASLLLGSVSRTVLQHATCPVAVIHHHTD